MLAALLASALPAAAAQPRPAAFPDLPDSAYQLLEDGRWLAPDRRRAALRLGGRELRFELLPSVRHPNGDLSLAGHAPGTHATARLTLGPAGVFGELREGQRLWLVTSDAAGSWLVELPATGFSYNQCATEAPARRKPLAFAPQDGAHRPSSAALHSHDPPATVIDVLLIYNQALAARYPGALLETRANHLLHIANQSTANTGVDVGFRLVGLEFFDYRNDNTNFEARNDMAATLSGDTRAGLAGLASRRSATGADLVIMLRPHDIEKRGSCGIAFFPDGSPELGVNVVSDGMSSWSVCLDDVLTHEIGHNLGAGHQAGAGGGAFDPRGAAFVRPGQFSTLMASFGTGRPDRFLGLALFSNPAVECGGMNCGVGSSTNNAAVIRDVAPGVAAYQGARSALPLPDRLPPDAAADSDGDGTSDWQDAFPFDPDATVDSDGDGVADVRDAFPGDPGESRDTDGDGVGDEQDSDDDGDGVADAQDEFPLDPLEAADQDADGVGDAGDAFPADPAEFADADGDGQGDNRDPDDDNDGFEDFDLLGEDLLVVSARNGRILRFDAATGTPRGIEVPPADSQVTFQTSLGYRASDHTLLYTGSSALRRLRLTTRGLLGSWVPPYADPPDGVELGTGFPTGLAVSGDGARIAVARLGDALIGQFQGQERARPNSFLQWSLSGGDEHIDLVADGDAAYILGNDTRTLYRAEGTNTTFLAGPDAGWMRNPRRLALTPDGRLLVSDAGRNGVFAVSTANGALLGQLADLDAAGYRSADGIAVTRAGELLVAASRDDVILAFDASTGAYLGERVSRRAGGLDGPRALLLVPHWLDRFPADPARVIRPNAGLWFNPASNGRGFDIEVFNNRLTAIWYTYEPSGLPVWYLATGVLEGFSFSAPLLRFQLDGSGASSFAEVGRLELSFASEREATLSYALQGVSGGEPLQWLAFDPGPAGLDYSGLWGRADGPGWGISLASQGSSTVAIAFLYDSAGEPRWVISDPVHTTSELSVGMHASFSTSLCPGCQGEPGFEFRPAGSMLLRPFTHADWSSAIDYPAPLLGDWVLEQTPIIRFSEAPERPR